MLGRMANLRGFRRKLQWTSRSTIPAFFSRDWEKPGNPAVRIVYISAGVVNGYLSIQSRDLPLHQVDRLKNIQIYDMYTGFYENCWFCVYNTDVILSMFPPHTSWTKRYFLATCIYHSISTTPRTSCATNFNTKGEKLRNYPIFSYAPLKGVTICYAFSSPQHNTVAASRHTHAPIPGLMYWR